MIADLKPYAEYKESGLPRLGQVPGHWDVRQARHIGRLLKGVGGMGGTESLIEHRASVEGAGTPAPPDLLRLSVGIEHVDDLIADMEQALKAAHA